MFNIYDTSFAFKLEPIVRLNCGTIESFEVLSIPLNNGMNEGHHSKGINKAESLSLLIRQLENYQKLNEQDKEMYNSVFIPLAVEAIDGGLSWGDFIPFLSQFNINIEISEWDICCNLNMSSLALLSRLKASGVRLWIDDVGDNYNLMPTFIRKIFYGVKLDKNFVRRCLKYGNIAPISHISSMWGATHVIAKGIETKSLSETYLLNGIGFGQGFCLGGDF